MGCGWSTPRPGRNLPQGKTRYPFYRRLGGPQSRPGQLRKISPHRDSIPGPSNPQRVAIPTEISRPAKKTSRNKIYRAFGSYSGNVSLPTWCISYLKETHLHLLLQCHVCLQGVGWGGTDWTDMAQDRDRWRALVNPLFH
jgi:hypothetical protein